LTWLPHDVDAPTTATGSASPTPPPTAAATAPATPVATVATVALASRIDGGIALASGTAHDGGAAVGIVADARIGIGARAGIAGHESVDCVVIGHGGGIDRRRLAL
jgi:hypothetical protein